MPDYNPVDIEAQSSLKRDGDARTAAAKEQADSDFLQLMSCDWGRRIVWSFLEYGGAFRLSFDTAPLVMAFNEGRKNEAFRVLECAHRLCPDLYMTMTQENKRGS